MIDILISIALGALAGWLAGMVMNSKGTLLRNIIIGIAGGFIGGYLFGLIGISFAGYIGTVIKAAAGACLLIIVARVITGK